MVQMVLYLENPILFGELQLLHFFVCILEIADQKCPMIIIKLTKIIIKLAITNDL